MVLVVEMMLMMISMMPGVMAMTMAAIPPSEREIPRQFSPCRSSSSLCLVSSSLRWRKNYLSIPPMVLGQRVIVCQRGAGGATGARGGSHPRPGAATYRGSTPGRGWWPPLLPGARLRAPFWLLDLFPKIFISEFFWNFWSFRRQVS